MLANNLMESLRNPKSIRKISPQPQIKIIAFVNINTGIPNAAMTKNRNVGTPSMTKPPISNIERNIVSANLVFLLVKSIRCGISA